MMYGYVCFDGLVVVNDLIKVAMLVKVAPLALFGFVLFGGGKGVSSKSQHFLHVLAELGQNIFHCNNIAIIYCNIFIGSIQAIAINQNIIVVRSPNQLSDHIAPVGMASINATEKGACMSKQLQHHGYSNSFC